MGEVETTLSEVLEAVQTGFAKVEDRLGTAETVLISHGKLLKTLVEGQDQIREDIHILDQRVSKTQSRVEDVVDEHQDTLLDHGRRIVVLEKTRA